MKFSKFKKLTVSISMVAILAVSPITGVIGNAASTSNVVSQREIQHAALAKKVAIEGMVLLENKNNVLPISKDKKTIALFGGGAARTIRGGTGSGDPFNGGLSGGGEADVNQSERYNINIYNSFKEANYTITTTSILDEYIVGYDAEYTKAAGSPMATFAYPELEFTNDELIAAKKGTDTAIYVISRNAGEGADRTMTKTAKVGEQTFEIGDYELTALEKENLTRVSDVFPNTVVVLNVGGIIDTKFFNQIDGLDSLLLMGQGGQEAGPALIDVLNGTETPSGKLTDTWAVNYSDNPAAETFANNDNNVDTEVYTEGIYVGYAYFDTFGITPAYEFGYGMSYTDFSIKVNSVEVNNEKVTVKVNVTNTGSKYSGKEVVQIYYSAPDTTAEKAYQKLAAFAKTDELAPGKTQTLTISYNISDMAYYNESKAAYVLDAGKYIVRVGDSTRNTHVAAVLDAANEKVVEQLSNQLQPTTKIDELSKSGKSPYTYTGEQQEIDNATKISIDTSKMVTKNNASKYDSEEVTTYTTDSNYVKLQDYEKVQVVANKEGATLRDVAKGTVTMEQFIAQMSAEELAILNCGSGWGVANDSSPVVGSSSSTIPGAAGETIAYENYEIPSIVLADGPGGIRVKQSFEATDIETGEKANYYQYCTAWPVSTVRAQTWNVDLVQELGVAFGVELKELGITLLLGPSLNIHRDPLCGRNFEYYSEDPYISGIMAAKITLGVQATEGVGACLKHYAANSQESNRNASDSVMSERTLREIYLKGFEIAVKSSQPMSMMTAYNKINGIPAADSYDLNTDIPRGEWGYEGLIMTDWNGGSSTPLISMHAGNDLIMPGGVTRADNILSGLKDNAPVFDAKGQIGLKEASRYMFIYPVAAWNEFTISATGTKTVTATLGDGNTASVDASGNILVNGETIYREYESSFWTGTGTYKTPLTNEFASVSADGKSITYKGNYPDNNIICLGDIQKSAMNNLNIIMKSNVMAKKYSDVTVKPYSSEFNNLANYLTINKSGVTDVPAPTTAPTTVPTITPPPTTAPPTIAPTPTTAPTTAPSKVTNLKAKTTTSAITLTWSKTDNASSYKVLKYNKSTKKYSTYKTTTSLSCKVTGLSAGKVYQFKVVGYNGSIKGTESSALKVASNPKKLTLASVKKTTSTKAKLTWKSSNADSVVIYMKKGSGKFKKVTTVKASKLTYTKTGLKKGTKYSFRIKAYKNAGSTKSYSSYSSVKSVK